MKETAIPDFVNIRARIANYLAIIDLCIEGFEFDHGHHLNEEDKLYLSNIIDGKDELRSLMNKLDNVYASKSLSSEDLTKFRHDLRLAINIILGYSEVILEVLAENQPSYVGGNFALILQATREILKNVDLLNAK